MSSMSRNLVILAFLFGPTVFGSPTTTSPETSTITADPVVTLFLPGPEWNPLTGSLAKIGATDPFTVVAHCPPGSQSTDCNYPRGNYGTFTAEPSSFVAIGIVGSYSYTIDCTIPKSDEATCTSIEYGPMSRDADGIVLPKQSDFSGTTATVTLTGNQVRQYPVTLTAGATKWLYPTQADANPAASMTNTATTTTTTSMLPNSAGTVDPTTTLGLLMVIAAFFFPC